MKYNHYKTFEIITSVKITTECFLTLTFTTILTVKFHNI